MAQRLAAVYDPTGAKFNVKPVTTFEDGRVVTLESIERKKEREALKRAEGEATQTETAPNGVPLDPQEAADRATALANVGSNVSDRLNPERMAILIESNMPQDRSLGGSKKQQKKMEQYAPRPPPPKPTIPEGVEIPDDEPEKLD